MHCISHNGNLIVNLTTRGALLTVVVHVVGGVSVAVDFAVAAAIVVVVAVVAAVAATCITYIHTYTV